MKITKKLSQLIEARILNDHLAAAEIILHEAPAMPAVLLLTFIWDFNWELSQN